MKRLGVREVFDQHADFVWRVLARAGVRDADLQDATQEVFLVVANKLEEFDESSKMTTWLFAIAQRVAANHRRKVQRKREDLVDAPPEPSEGTGSTPEIRLARAEARQRLSRVLEALPGDQRIVFELFELEEMTCPAIAEALGIPLGTTYTRLRAARASFERLAKVEAEAERA